MLCLVRTERVKGFRIGGRAGITGGAEGAVGTALGRKQQLPVAAQRGLLKKLPMGKQCPEDPPGLLKGPEERQRAALITLGTGGGIATRQAPQPETLHGGGSDKQRNTDLHLLPPADPRARPPEDRASKALRAEEKQCRSLACRSDFCFI